jgi:hypothetical protein
MLTEHYQCPDCGATIHSHIFDLCDTCVMKFYYDNPNASALEERF